MCTSPIFIKNRTKEYHEGLTRSHMYVPCGKCEDCRSKKSQDWFLRTMAEYRECVKNGGKVITATFTYNNEHLPRYYYVDDFGNTKSFPCFSKLDKHQYIQALKDFFRNRYNLRGKDAPTIRFIWCSEYGEDERFTHRPHYHVLFFVPYDILELVKYDRSLWLIDEETTWKELLRKFWQYEPYNRGFVRWKYGSSIFANSDAVARYCSKYITKSIEFFRQPEVDEFLKDCDGNIDKEKLKMVRQHLPNHWQSMSFGYSLVDSFKDLDAYCEGVDFNFVTDVDKGKQFKYKVPSYVDKKLNYIFDVEGRYHLTEDGIKFKFEKFRRKLLKYASKYLQFEDLDTIEKFISSVDIERSEILCKYKSKNELQQYITSILLHSSEKALEIYLYNRVWSGFFTEDVQDVIKLDNMDFPNFLQTSLNRYYSFLYTHRLHNLKIIGYGKRGAAKFADFAVRNFLWEFDENGIFHDRDPRCDSFVYYYDKCSRFSGFKEFLNVIGEIQNIYRRRSHLQYYQDYLKRKHNNFLLAKVS